MSGIKTKEMAHPGNAYIQADYNVAARPFNVLPRTNNANSKKSKTLEAGRFGGGSLANDEDGEVVGTA